MAPVGPVLPGPGRVLELLPLYQVKGTWCGCHTVSFKVRMLSVASKRKKTQLGLSLKPGQGCPLSVSWRSTSCLPTLRHPLSHKLCFSWPRCCWDPPEPPLGQGQSAPLDHEAAARSRVWVPWPQRGLFVPCTDTHHSQGTRVPLCCLSVLESLSTQGRVLELFIGSFAYIPFFSQSNALPCGSAVSVAKEPFWGQLITSIFFSVHLAVSTVLFLLP